MPYVQIIIAIVMLIASYAITALTMKRPENNTKPSTFNDFDFPQAEEGTPQSVVFGDVWLPDYQILWYGNYRSSEIYSGSGGKKG